MMNEEENRPRPKTTHEIGCDLSTISAEELAARITLLRAEIARIERELAAKHSSRAAAESFFKL